MHNPLKKKSGFILVVALGIVALITIVMVELAETTIHGAREIGSSGSLKEANSAGLSGLHVARRVNTSYGGPGFQMSCQSDGTGCIFPGDNVDFKDINGSYADWQIQGRAACIRNKPLDPKSCVVGFSPSETFYVPRPSTGNAIKGCDPLRVYPDANEDGIYDADHPCNWGKIGYKDIVAIPLYVMDYDFDNKKKIIVNPSDDPDTDGIIHILGMTLRMRTPCKDKKALWCEPVDRYELDGYYHDLNKDGMPDDTVVLWQITGGDKSEPGKQLYLIPDDKIDELADPLIRHDCNSEIYETKINDAYIYDFQVLNGNKGSDCEAGGGTIVEAGRDQDGNLITIYDFLINENLDKPVLSLQVIGSLIESSDGKYIPYLEYQLVIEGDSEHPPADIYQTLISEGYSPGYQALFKQSWEQKEPLDTGLTKFVISN